MNEQSIEDFIRNQVSLNESVIAQLSNLNERCVILRRMLMSMQK